MRWLKLPFGRDVVREMNRLRMLIDISHLNEPGFWEVLELSEAPVIASHSCARALRDHPANLTDEQIRALAEKRRCDWSQLLPKLLD